MNWKNKNPEDLTIEDAIQACQEGTCFVCADGAVKHFAYGPTLSNDSLEISTYGVDLTKMRKLYHNIIKVLDRKELAY